MSEQNDNEAQDQPKKPFNLAHELVKRKYPLIGPELSDQSREFGELLVSEKSLASPNGFLYAAEHTDQGTEDLTDQVVSSLIMGASRELTSAVFSEIGIIPPTTKNQAEWRSRFEYEYNYLKKLLEDRRRIGTKTYTEGPSATVDLLQRLEYAYTLKQKEREAYIDRVAHDKAIENLGIREEDMERYKKEIEEREQVERAYYQNAFANYALSDTKRKLSFLDS